jgi:hypothetical protein
MGAAFTHSKSERTCMKISENCLEHFNKIKRILYVGLLLWMRLGFTITHQNRMALGWIQRLKEMSAKSISWGGYRWLKLRANKLTTFTCQLYRNSGSM